MKRFLPLALLVALSACGLTQEQLKADVNLAATIAPLVNDGIAAGVSIADPASAPLAGAAAKAADAVDAGVVKATAPAAP